ncbi:MAG: hypothetical protein AAGA96_20590 [Verrucomicrobiota bacterium]
MNSESPESGVDYEQRLIDAAISEHARLGSEQDDEALISKVLHRTIFHSDTEPSPLPGQPPESRIWLKASFAALIAISLIALALDRLPYGADRRASDELQFVVTLAPGSTSPVEPSERSNKETSPPRISGNPYQTPQLTHQESPTLHEIETPDGGRFEVTTLFRPSLDSLPQPAVREDRFAISADRMTREDGLRIYRGNVRIEHHDFLFEAAEALLPDQRSSADKPYFEAKDVVFTRHLPSQTARAGLVRYDPITGELVFSQVDSFETGNGMLGQFGPTDRLVVAADGFTIYAQ